MPVQLILSKEKNEKKTRQLKPGKGVHLVSDGDPLDLNQVGIQKCQLVRYSI